MLKFVSAQAPGRRFFIATTAGLIAATQLLAGPGRAGESKSVDSSSVTTDRDSVSLDAQHHYDSPADRANDALLITEVKSAIAEDGVAEDSVIVVDCDHGRILLSGVMRSAADAERVAKIAANAQGVIAVNNQLTWH